MKYWTAPAAVLDALPLARGLTPESAEAEMHDTEPAWLVEGGPVLVDDLRRGITRSVIERLTKTRVVLADGTRFNRQTLCKRGGGGAWDSSLYLRAPDEPAILRRLASQQYRAKVSSTRSKVDSLMLAWTRADEGDLSAAHAAAIHLRDAIADLEGLGVSS